MTIINYRKKLNLEKDFLKSSFPLSRVGVSIQENERYRIDGIN